MMISPEAYSGDFQEEIMENLIKERNRLLNKLKKYEILLVINKYIININTNIHILVILLNNLFLSLITLKIQGISIKHPIVCLDKIIIPIKNPIK